ncbi:MAG TPA: lamin tail domain-containing protein [Marinilabiliaceae bacterium]|nr:lamin tail domain-containing protein [Marinilabiliaceae bacterium]
MRTFFLVLALFLFVNTDAQIADDFSDGDFTNNPTWVGLDEWFSIDEVRQSLQLNAPAEAGNAWLSTASNSMENAQWQFSFRMGFNPSSSNYAQVYLAADQNDPSLISRSLYLVMGTTADNISLWEMKGSTKKLLIEGTAGRLDLSAPEGQVRVKRNKGGVIILETNMGSGWLEEGKVDNHIGFPSQWFGLSCHYTSTRSKLFWFDDFLVTGESYRDTIPLAVEKSTVKNKYVVTVEFSKPVAQLNYQSSFFVVQPSGETPEISLTDNPYQLQLLFSKGVNWEDGEELKISGITDLDENVLDEVVISHEYLPVSTTNWEVLSPQLLSICFSGQVDELFATSLQWQAKGPQISEVIKKENNCFQISLNENFPLGEALNIELIDVVAANGDTISVGPYELWYYLAQPHDLVISEIMPDPSPAVGLPDSEFIELFNRSEFPISLKNYQLIVSNKTAKLPEIIVFPEEYLLLVPSTQKDLWTGFSNHVAVSSWPTLPNGGADVVLQNSQGEVITALTYSPAMGELGYKQEGGWSFELIDLDNLSGDLDNWTFSIDNRGGTPGEPNSMASSFTDRKPPQWQGLYLLNDSCIVMEFSEPVSNSFLSPLSNFKIQPFIGIHAAELEEIFGKSCKLCFEEQLTPNVVYELQIEKSPEDLAGNRMQLPQTIRIARPVVAEPFDLVINELLYDPNGDVKDFVELYNRSDKILDLSTLYVAKENVNGVADKLIRLSDKRRMFFTGDHLVFTADKNALVAAYDSSDPSFVYEVAGFPNYVNAGGIVFITDVSGKTLDRFDYSEHLHFPLLSSTKGVSLERIDVNGSTNDVNNWHSAAADVGYATPTLRNSQAVEGASQSSATFVLEPEVFTPNLDGVDDLLFIRYNFPEAGYSCTVEIFNQSGSSVRKLVNNQLVGTHGFFAWDGTNDNGQRCNSGIYIVLIKWFNLKGEVKEEKRVTVLGR